MKISQLEEKIKELETRTKYLGSEQVNIEKSIEKIRDNSVINAGELVLSKYLQPEEREYLKKCYETENYDEKEKLRENIEKFIFEKVKDASDEEKIVLGQYLFDKNVFYGCGDFGSFKNPTTCGGCHKGEAIVNKLGLRKYTIYLGDRCYEIPQGTKDKAIQKVGGEEIEKKMIEKKQKLEDIVNEKKDVEKELKKMAKIKSAYIVLENSGTDYEAVETQMPDFFSEITKDRDRSGVRFAIADLKKNVGVILTDDWAYYGSGGCEYGITAIVYRDGNTEEKYFKFRDPYDPYKDDFRYQFDKAKIKKIDKDKVEIELENTQKNSLKRKFSF